MFQRLKQQNRQSVRFFCEDSVNPGTTAESVERSLPQIGLIKLFQGDTYIDHVAYGESVFGPLHDNMLAPMTNPRPDQLALWRKIATENAKARLPLIVHATIEGTFGPFLDQIEAVNKEYPVNSLRWAFAHMDQVTAAHLERMKKLNMYAAVGAAGHHGPDLQSRPRRSIARHAAAQDDPGRRHHLGAAHRYHRGQPVPAVHDAVVGGDRQDGGRGRRSCGRRSAARMR